MFDLSKKRYFKINNYEEYRMVIKALVDFGNDFNAKGMPFDEVGDLQDRLLKLKPSEDGSRLFVLRDYMDHSIVYRALKGVSEKLEAEGQNNTIWYNLYRKAYRAPTRQDMRQQKLAERVR